MSELLFSEKFFDDGGNWKNSEVMREFVDLLEANKKESPPVIESEEKLVLEKSKECDVPSEDFDFFIDFEPDFELAANLEYVHKNLKKLATDSAKYGNEKATFEIEKAYLKVEDILMKLDSGEL